MFDMDTHITPGMITVDCIDARALAHFWSEATGAPIIMDYEGYFVMIDTTPTLGFQRVDDPAPGKNRVHIDSSYGTFVVFHRSKKLTHT